MSERTFRAVVAVVLVGALLLAVAVSITLLVRNPTPSASLPSSVSPVATTVPSVAPSRPAGHALASANVVSVGLVPAGSESAESLVLQFDEPSVAAIPNGAGSFRFTLSDHAGNGSSVAFVGTAAIEAPGSLGASAALVAPNILEMRIVASDPFNIESLTIRGLGIRAAANAALGPIRGTLSDFSGSLAGGIADPEVQSPGTVVATSPSPAS